MTHRLQAAIGRQIREPLFRSAYSLILNTGLASVLGLVFWIVAARLYPAEDIGRDAALIAAMLSLSGICQLNLGTTIPRFLPQVLNPARRMAQAYAASVGTAVVVATIFIVVAPRLTDRLAYLHGSAGLEVAFVAGTALWGIFALQDAALTATRRAIWVPIENVAFGVLKLGALPLMVVLGSPHGVFSAWVIPMAVLLVPVNYVLFRIALPRENRTDRARVTGTRRWIAGFLAQDYVASVLGYASLTLLPLIVVALVSTEANAYFYLALTIVVALDLMVTNVATSLTVEAAIDESRLGELARAAVRRFVLPLFGAVAVIVLAAHQIMSIFGPEYAQNGAVLLQVLIVATPFRAVVALFTTICRARGRARPILLCDAGLFALTIGLSFALAPSYGAAGVAAAWLISNATVGSFLLPSIITFLRTSATGDRDSSRSAGDQSRGDGGRPAPWGTSRGLPALGGGARRLLSGARDLTSEAAGGGPHATRAATIGLALAVSLTAGICVALGATGPVPAVAIGLLFAMGPGAVLMPFVSRVPRSFELGLVIGVSLTFSVLFAQSMLTFATWEPRIAAATVAWACVAGLSYHVIGYARLGALRQSNIDGDADATSSRRETGRSAPRAETTPDPRAREPHPEFPGRGASETYLERSTSRR